MNRPFAWSYSRLSAYELCPSKYAHDNAPENKGKDRNDASDYGGMVHKKFEIYMQDEIPLPLDLQHHRPYLDKIRGMGEVLPEQKLAITRAFQPTGWFDNDVWCRGIIDFCAIDRDRHVAVIIDYKTGKRRLNWEQVQMQAALLECYGMELSGFVLGYYWTKDKKYDLKKLPADGIPAVWNDLLPRVERMEEAVAAGTFPPKQNFLCKSYCANKECKYNG
jgi:hypothetical protein